MVEMIKDEQGFEIKLGYPYQFIFAMPGPDVTLLRIDEIISQDEIRAYDLLFGFTITVKASKLFRPVKKGWDKWDLERIIKNDLPTDIG